MWWTPEYGGSQAKKSILHHLIYDACLVLYPMRLGGGDWQNQQEEILGHPIVLPSGKPTCNLKLLQAFLACIELWFAGDTTYMSERKTIWSFSCVHQLPSAIMRMLDDESRLTQDRHFLWKDFLVAESTECDFLPSPSKCLNFLSFGILINISSSHAASTLTESEPEHICKRIRTLIMPGGIFSTHSVAPDAVLSHI